MSLESARSPGASKPASPPTSVKTPWSLRFQLLLGVNVTLGLILTLALVADYRRELAHHLRHEQAALLAEAETIAAALPGLHPVDRDSIRRLLDSVLTGMSAADSPRHRILVEWEGVTIESHVAAAASDAATSSDKVTSLKEIISTAPLLPSGPAIWETGDFAIGSCSKDGFTVHVAEPLASLQREIRFETIERLLVLIAAGLVAMAVVYFIILRALVRPMEHLSRTVEAIGAGRLGTQVGEYRTEELSVLAKSINTMSTTLAQLDRERKYQMSKAKKLQQHLLAPWPDIPGMIAERRFLPATEVTGDYHEAYPLPDGEWLFCIADVTGHGIPAAMTAAMLKVLFHQVARQTHDPHLLLQELNSRMGMVVIPGDFATMLIIHWQPQQQRIQYANAGHEPGILIRPSGEVLLMESDGFMVGAVPSAVWNLHTLPVANGDRILMYTDGAVEVFNSERELFGRKRLQQAVVDARQSPPRDVVASVIQSLDEYRGSRPFADDITLIMMELMPC